jgi:hypothetical protein
MNFVDKTERNPVSSFGVFQTIILFAAKEVFRLHPKVKEFL